MRRKICLALIISILFLSSCGMPTYHNFGYYSGTISISSRSSVPGVDTDYQAGFLVRVTDVDPDINSIDSQTPSVLLMYSISYGSSSLASRFNTVYRASSNYYNGSPAVFESNGRLQNVSATLDGEDIYLYRFTNGSDGSSLSSAPTYTYNSLKIGKYYYFAIRSEQRDDGTFSLVMDVYERDNTSSIGLTDADLVPTESIRLNRYNGNAFTNLASGGQGVDDYSYYDASNSEVSMDDYNIQLFMAVNLLPSESASFNNLYWSTLSNTRIDVV